MQLAASGQADPPVGKGIELRKPVVLFHMPNVLVELGDALKLVGVRTQQRQGTSSGAQYGRLPCREIRYGTGKVSIVFAHSEGA